MKIIRETISRSFNTKPRQHLRILLPTLVCGATAHQLFHTNGPQYGQGSHGMSLLCSWHPVVPCHQQVLWCNTYQHLGGCLEKMRLQMTAGLLPSSSHLWSVCHIVTSNPCHGDWILRNIKIWVRSRNCGCLVTWFCYQLIAKPGNKTATVPWPDRYTVQCRYNAVSFFTQSLQ